MSDHCQQLGQQLMLFDYPQSEKPSKKGIQHVGMAEVSYPDTKEILTRASGFMSEYDFTLNPYSGCSFGCTYCYAAFFATSKEEQDQWGYWVKVKDNAREKLDIRKKSLDGKLIYMSSVTDPYQPIERKLKLTQSLLEILAEKHKPKLVVQTRSPDVVRDIELFKRMIERGGKVQINMTVTTDDEEIRSSFEPFCPSNKRRLEAISEIASHNIEACITMTPLIWVTNPEQFAEDLLKTGVKKFIIQQFHPTRGKFVAGTRDTALQKMTEKLKHSSASTYEEHYGEIFKVLKSHLSCCDFGEGKDGFAPPF